MLDRVFFIDLLFLNWISVHVFPGQRRPFERLYCTPLWVLALVLINFINSGTFQELHSILNWPARGPFQVRFPSRCFPVAVDGISLLLFSAWSPDLSLLLSKLFLAWVLGHNGARSFWIDLERLHFWKLGVLRTWQNRRSFPRHCYLFS